MKELLELQQRLMSNHIPMEELIALKAKAKTILGKIDLLMETNSIPSEFLDASAFQTCEC